MRPRLSEVDAPHTLAVVLDTHDVRSGLGYQSQESVECAGLVVDDVWNAKYRPDALSPKRITLSNSSGSMLPPERITTTGGLSVPSSARMRRDAGGPRGLQHELHALGREDERLGYRLRR